MFRKTVLQLIPLLLVVSACSKNDDGIAPETAGGNAMELPVHRPVSGGEMVLVPAGEFTMGDPAGRPDESPHEVSLSAFYADRYLVSQQIFERVMRVNPSKRKAADNPVERVQWADAALFCNKCSRMEGLTPCYDPETWQCDFQASGYRLPTEAEWEYACRAGSQTVFFFGDDESELTKYAWFKPHSRGRPRPMGSKRPNQWGLYDMHGNVWQWCNDFYNESYYAESPREDPRGPATGKQRVLRGGAWNTTAEKCRDAFRFKEFPVYSDACFGADSYGFRRVRNGDVSQDGTKLAAQTAKNDSPDTSSAQHPAETSAAVAGVSLPADSSATGKANDDPTTVRTPVMEPAPTMTSAAEATVDPSRLRGTIVFASDRSGSLDIWKMNPSGKNLRQLTNDTHSDADPRFSPDGRQIMYTTLRGGFPEIWMMRGDGSEPTRIAEGSQAAWSPDGKSIVFIRDNQTYVRELASEAERRLAPESWQRCGVPAWSPDGRRIALASRHLGKIGIFVFSADGTTHDQLETEVPCCTPHWSPDGGRMLFQTVRGHIHEVNLERGDEEQLTFGADIQHDGRYSPDGSMMVFCRAPIAEGPWQLCIVDLNSDELDSIQITREGSNTLPDWHAIAE